MYGIRLAAKSSPEVKMAVRATMDQGRPRADVYSSDATQDGAVEVKAGAKTVASGVFENHIASILVPKTATEVHSKEAGSAPIDFTNLPDLVTTGLLNIRPMFKQSVFSGAKFPVCDLEKSADSEQTLGKCTLTPTFYDADYNEVKTADKPGRYGAIIAVETAGGQKFNRYATLYRAPEELLGRILRPEFADIKLPPELGIDPTVVSSHLKSVGDLFGTEFRTNAGMNRGPDAAILLAWLSETKADSATDLQRTGPSAADQKWWYGLKKKTGNLRTDYFVHLPPDYDKDPSKKWPVILFLHGSGERGYDLKILARQPLVQDIEKRKDFPFILIAPQVSPGEWWSIPELDDLLDGLPAKYRIDPDRIYLTGLSMGGFATWAYLAAEPGRFAAAVPICGGGDPADAARFKDMPIWVFHGGKDDAVPIQRSEEMVDALKKLGSTVKFTIYPTVDHFSWIPAYKTTELFEWLLQQKRPPHIRRYAGYKPGRAWLLLAGDCLVFLESLDCFFVLAGVLVADREVVPRVIKCRVEFHRALVGLDRLGVFLLLHHQVPERVVIRDIFRGLLVAGWHRGIYCHRHGRGRRHGSRFLCLHDLHGSAGRGVGEGDVAASAEGQDQTGTGGGLKKSFPVSVHVPRLAHRSILNTSIVPTLQTFHSIPRIK